jgi:hypothetical protein
MKYKHRSLLTIVSSVTPAAAAIIARFFEAGAEDLS